MKQLQDHPWPFHLKIVQHESQLLAGANRNAACQTSTGDLLICQDADDVPHRQRVEVLKYLFENYKIDFLIHKFSLGKFQIKHFDKTEMADACDHILGIDEDKLRNQPQGCPALTREVFQAVRWENIMGDEDSAYNQITQKIFKDYIILEASLLIYRPDLSISSK